jgi:hypothetical protein
VTLLFLTPFFHKMQFEKASGRREKGEKRGRKFCIGYKNRETSTICISYHNAL